MYLITFFEVLIYSTHQKNYDSIVDSRINMFPESHECRPCTTDQRTSYSYNISESIATVII